jgi:glycosyltransferase involved in cell wall biosynthesis
MPFAWKLFERELQTFDLIINSSWAFAHSAGGSHPRKISYIHTPGRYWWFPSIDQRTQIKIPKFLIKLIRKIDLRLSQKPNNYIANSEETRKRIRECWGQESELVYPPVNLDFYSHNEHVDENQGFILGVGRFVGYKNHDFIIKLGEALGKKVVLAGHGPNLDYLTGLALRSSTEVKIYNSPTNSELRELYFGALCLVYPTYEDFGIVPVEAMGCGLQVLGLSQGGLLETVEDGLAGSLVPTLELHSFIEAFNDLPNRPKVEIKQSVANFHTLEFDKRIIQIVSNVLEQQV